MNSYGIGQAGLDDMTGWDCQVSLSSDEAVVTLAMDSSRRDSIVESLTESARTRALALSESLRSFRHDSSLGWLRRRPRLLRDADQLMRQVMHGDLHNVDVKLELIESARKLGDWLAQQQPSRSKSRNGVRFEKISALYRQIQDHVRSATSIRDALLRACHQAEAHAEPALFSDVFMRQHPECIEYNENGEPILKSIRFVSLYDAEEAKWVMQRHQQRPKIVADERLLSDAELKIAKIIDPDFGRYQAPLRDHTFRNSWSERGVLLENLGIVDALSRYQPEAVVATRYAQTFPCGEADPSKLVVGERYKCPGYLFVGGERSNDDGFQMRIALQKGYPVDAHGFYGHQPESAYSKMQWVTLPGAVFVFKGATCERGRSIYRFDQADR